MICFRKDKTRLKTGLKCMSIFLCLISALYPSVKTDAYTHASANTEWISQGEMIRDLLKTFMTIPSWPATISSGKDTNVYFVFQDAKLAQNVWLPPSPVTATAWIGLHCVFPNKPFNEYPRLLDIHTKDPLKSVTAGQVSEWIVNWSIIARKINLLTEPTRNPFQLLRDFSVFWGTGITSPNQIITRRQALEINNNLVSACRGWRVMAPNEIMLLSPFQTCGLNYFVPTTDPLYNLKDSVWISWSSFIKTSGDEAGWILSDWPKVYGKIVQSEDSSTLILLPNGNISLNAFNNSNYHPGPNLTFANSDQYAVGNYETAIPINEGHSSRIQKATFPFVLSPIVQSPSIGHIKMFGGFPNLDTISYFSSPFYSGGTTKFLLPGPAQTYEIGYVGSKIIRVGLDNYIANGPNHCYYSTNYLAQILAGGPV